MIDQAITARGGPLPHLLVINQYYEPDIAATGVLLAQLCEGLAEQGFTVTVVTGQPSYTDAGVVAPTFEVVNGVEIHRIALGKSLGRTSMRSRLFGYFKFLYRARRLAAQLGSVKRPDIVVTASNPPLVERTGRHIARKFGAAHVHIIHDIHPEVLLAGGQIWLPPMAAPLWRRLSTDALKSCSRIVVLSENMKRNLVDSRGIHPDNVQVINLWATVEHDEPLQAGDTRQRYGIPDDHLLISHTGNIGVVQGLDGVIKAAALVKDEPITFLLLGEGAMKPELERQAARLQLKNVRFLPYQSDEDYLRILAASDACLVTLRPGMERYSLPSKTFTFLSAGKPILGLLQPGNDISTILEQHDVGWNSTDPESLSDRLHSLCENREEIARAGVNAQVLYRQKYNRTVAVNTYSTLFKALLNHND